MTVTETPVGLQDFASGYIRGVRHHEEIRTEHLAEAFRTYFGLPEFPTLSDLYALCPRLGVKVFRLPRWAPMEGVNAWQRGRSPEIHLRSDLNPRRSNTTVGHELRELIETAFKRSNHQYIGLDTADNKMMHRESEHFASCLLMPAEASRVLLEECGFDVQLFSARTGRSLASVVVRLQSLYSVATRLRKPHAGVWLFEAPWDAVADRSAKGFMMTANFEAKLCGFSLKKERRPGPIDRRALFPTKSSSLWTYDPGQLAVELRGCVMEKLSGLDLFGEHNFTVISEPIYRDDVPAKVLVVAIRNDSLEMFQPWIKRLPIVATGETGRAATA